MLTGMRPIRWVVPEVAFGKFPRLKLGSIRVGVCGKRAVTLVRPHLCMPTRGQDAVAVLTFQAETVPVLA